MSDNPQLPQDSSHHLINPQGYAHRSILEDKTIALCGARSNGCQINSMTDVSSLPECPTCAIKRGVSHG